MGLTLIRKSRGAPPHNPHVALVLAGGAVTGGAFKVGGLKALDDFLVSRRVTDFDTYVGLSAGALLAAALAAGVTPGEMVRVLEGQSERLDQLGPLDFYHPNWREYAARPARFFWESLTFAPATGLDLLRALPGLPEALGPPLRAFLRRPSYTRWEALALEARARIAPSREVPSPAAHIPSGIFDNRRLERWLRRNFERLRMPNDFEGLRDRRGRDLFITACNLDSAEREVFGCGENLDLTISEAVQASTALPLLYRPARIRGVEYVDGGVYRTANIDVAIEKGADLIVCYNPFRPITNRLEGVDGRPGRHLSDWGLKAVLNQSFRTLLHSRLKQGLQRYLLDTRFRGDIVLLEPRERDVDFFNVNPLAFWKRAQALQHGFDSVRATIEQNFDVLAEVFARYGMNMSRVAAQRRAARTRAQFGWQVPEEERDLPSGRPELRVVS